MQSSGGTIAAQNAGKYAVHMLLSGPAGGLAGASFAASYCGKHRLLTFDMGGTSTDVSLIDGQLKLTSEGKINNYPVAIPMVDVHTIGAGGGSIAWIDEGGMLQVGPESAGASPGPACYGKAGTRPTVTDANLVVGRLLSRAFLGGEMTLDVDKARDAISTIAAPLNLSIEETALGIIRIANEHMAQALRVISIQRGLAPRQFTLVSFGGAGGLHVCALADALGMSEAIVPIHAGVLSALGMLIAPRSRHLSKTVSGIVCALDANHINGAFAQLAQEGQTALQQEDIAKSEIRIKNSIDARYIGQSYSLCLPWRGLKYIHEDFNRLHEERYGHQLPLEVELVNLHVEISGPPSKLELEPCTPIADQHTQPVLTNRLYGIEETVHTIARDALIIETVYVGPLIITETTSTIFVASGWRCQKDRYGNLLLTKNEQGR
jgi:N-methylhydantoinase A